MPVLLKYSRIFFGFAFLLLLYLFFRIIEPFLVTVILAITLVSLFYPNYVELNRRFKGRPNLSSAVMCLIVTVLIIIPLLLFFLALLKEFGFVYDSFRAELSNGNLGGVNMDWPQSPFFDEIRNQFSQYLGIEGMDLGVLITSLFDRLAQYLFDHYALILGGIGVFVFKFVLMVISMFFFFRDGDVFVQELKKLVPLAPEHEDLVLAKLKQTTYATFFGIFATGICQGIVAGFIFFLLGIESPILWGTATAVFSLVPFLGTATVWLPMSLYFLASGSHTRGILLFILGALVISMADNLIRPLIIEVQAKGMHLLLVFLSLAGGLILFGPPGLVLGPLIVVLFLTFLEIYKIEFREELDPTLSTELRE